MSFGGDPSNYQHALAEALQKAEDAGIGLVTSAGNGDSNQGSSPCGYTKYIQCVGATTQKYQKYKHSNYDGNVTVWAPGEHIWTAGPGADNEYVALTQTSRHTHTHEANTLPQIYSDGASIASPQIAGLLALYISFEAITTDAAKVYNRLSQNWQKDILTKDEFIVGHEPLPNLFAHTGLKHPKKDSRYPYNGVGHDELVSTFEEVLHNQNMSLAMKGDAAHPPEKDLGLIKEPEIKSKPTPTSDACPPPTPCVKPATVC
jgi:subtilisin family serine protease